MAQTDRAQKTGLAARIGMIAIRAYQLVLSPLWPATCRFEPSCSTYGMEALKTHGAFKGTALALWRILRCNPWNAGGYDPVPDHHPSHSGCTDHNHGSDAAQTTH